MTVALAIDAGSSSVRTALYDAAGQRVAGSVAQIDVDLTAGAGGIVQIDAALMRAAIEQAIDTTLLHPAAKAGVEVVGMSTFWHSLVAVDRAGNALTPVLTWADTRSAQEAAELRAALDATAVHQRTGCVLHPSYLPAKIRWLTRHDPSLANAAGLLSFAQYCGLRWLGTSATSVSMASGSGLYDHVAGRWDEELLATLGVPVAALGEFLPDPEFLPPLRPEYARRWPRLARARWRAPIGDGAASNVGSGCVSGDTLALMVGTSGALRRCEVDAGGHEPTPAGLWRYRLDRQRSLTGGALSDAGNVYEWLRETLLLPDDDTLERELAAREPGRHGLVVLPFWSGERSPGWVGDATAIVAGLRRHTTAIDIFHAALEAVAHRFAALHGRLARGGETVVASGGGLRESPAWTQLMADALGVPVVAANVVEASLRGAALVALREIGFLNELPEHAGGVAYLPDLQRTEIHRQLRTQSETLYDREVGAGGANLLARQTR